MADDTNHNGNGTVHVRKFERTAFPTQKVTIDSIIKQIKELGSSGSLTINFYNGSMAGPATFEREIKDKK